MTDRERPKGSVTSMDANENSLPPTDAMEAIYALNIGDFLAEDFISDELLHKINNRLGSNPEKLRRQLDEMIQIYSIDKTLGILGFESNEGFIIYDSIASTLAEMFQVDACHLFQEAHRDTGEQYLSLSGTSKNVAGQNRWKIGIEISGETLLSQACQDNETLVLPQIDPQKMWEPLPPLEQEKVQSLIATPMTEGGKHLGLILFESYKERSFSSELVNLAEATAQVFVTSLRLQQLVARAQTEVNNSVETERDNSPELLSLRAELTESIADLGEDQQHFVELLGAAIDARNDFTEGHSKQVAEYAHHIADAMELNEKTIDLVYFAGLLGSIGKMDIPQQIMTKKDHLSTNEWEDLRNHPNVGVALLVQINFLSEVIPYVNYQHERWDGSGTPEGRTGRNIPLGSRILALADAYQAMTAKRPYRDEPMTHQEALSIIQEEAGTKWDPVVVEAFSKISEASLQSSLSR